MNLNSTCTLGCRKSTGHSFNREKEEPTYIAFQRLILGMQSSNSFTGNLARRNLFTIQVCGLALMGHCGLIQR